MIVTDYKSKLKDGRIKIGYYMDGYLYKNMEGIKDFLKKRFDVVGIVSGHGLVGTGKSTMAIQIGHLISWLLAGGKMDVERYSNGKYKTSKITPPKKPVNFNLQNVVFTPDELVSRSEQLYKKFGPGQVIIYDEGMAGLDSARAMESINKGMQDFFSRCRIYGHVIIIVLPNFFKLHEDYAVARSIFLVDVYLTSDMKRGQFRFYNTRQKEYLYFFGKKRLGVTARYTATNPNFRGRFTDFFPLDKTEYDKLKVKAINTLSKTKRQIRFMKQRNAALYLIKKYTEKPAREIAEDLSITSGEKVGERQVQFAIASISKRKPSEIE